MRHCTWQTSLGIASESLRPECGNVRLTGVSEGATISEVRGRGYGGTGYKYLRIVVYGFSTT